MVIFNGILAALPVIGQIISLFIKTPADQLTALNKKLLDLVQEMHAAVDKSVETKGDTSAIEDIINRRQ